MTDYVDGGVALYTRRVGPAVHVNRHGKGYWTVYAMEVVATVLVAGGTSGLWWLLPLFWLGFAMTLGEMTARAETANEEHNQELVEKLRTRNRELTEEREATETRLKERDPGDPEAQLDAIIITHSYNEQAVLISQIERASETKADRKRRQRAAARARSRRFNPGYM